jgi:DnaJ-class molecular chaperone
VALCNVGSLNQYLFEQPQQQGGGGGGAVQQGGNLFGQAQNVFNGFVNNAGFGNYNQQNNNNNNNNRRPRPPHASPCPKKFQYASNGKEWKGVIRLNNVDLSRDLLIEADFAVPQRNVSI